MTTLRAFVLAFLAGMAASFVPSCGNSGQTCTAASCQGCCGSDGLCKPGTAGGACGKQGGVCIACSSAETCQAGVCTPGNQQTPCNATSCPNGCCAANGACISPATGVTACGQGGGACQVCASGQSCVAGSCQGSGGCTGCTSGGSCVAGTSDAQCGRGGVACLSCVAGSACTNGQCTPTCTGCLDSTATCQTTSNNAHCGTGGVACVACTGTAACTNGQCVVTGCNGCVDGTGACQPGTATGACGAGGTPCQACTGSATCSGGSCQSSSCMSGDPCMGHAFALCANSSTCVANICSHDPGCCTSGWNSVCAGYDVNTYCPGQCGGGFDGGVNLNCTTPDTTAACQSACGTERWDVKVTTDPGAPQISKNVVTATVAQLLQKPTYTPSASAPRGSDGSQTEFTIFLVKNAVLNHIKLETDADYHMVIQDPNTGGTMVTEIPCYGCSSSGAYGCRISHARNAFETKYGSNPGTQSVNTTVTVVGIGFYDPPHGQTGAAPNNLELHPILGICFGQDCDPTAN